MTPSSRTSSAAYFYPRPPRGGRRAAGAVRTAASKFLSTPSARRATTYYCHSRAFELISIHALREEGDVLSALIASASKVFLSTPSARRATRNARSTQPAPAISIHALREEGDGLVFQPGQDNGDFYPRPPRGGRPTPISPPASAPRPFLSTPSARRATNCNPLTTIGS